jgi:DNA-binding response OmpR family regulator
MVRPRVLLVEDDAAIRRLVAMVLEDLDIDLRTCADVAQARAELRAAPVRLVITDLMMPGVSGFELLAELAADARLRAGARLVAFSAGLDAAARARLAACDVWRLLSKPVSVLALEACVREALQNPAWPDPAAPAPLPAVPSALPGTLHATLAVDEAGAIARHFAGNVALYESFKAACRQQFGADLQAGAAAIAAADLAALRRLGHNLKSVLLSLGHDAAAAQAAALEAAAVAGARDEMVRAWTTLQSGLQALAAADSAPAASGKRSGD